MRGWQITPGGCYNQVESLIIGPWRGPNNHQDFIDLAMPPGVISSWARDFSTICHFVDFAKIWQFLDFCRISRFYQSLPDFSIWQRFVDFQQCPGFPRFCESFVLFGPDCQYLWNCNEIQGFANILQDYARISIQSKPTCTILQQVWGFARYF